MPVIYVVDTSALIQFKNDLPGDVFRKPWEFLTELIAEGRLIAPHEVFREIERGDDELVEWVRSNPAMFVAVDGAQGEIVTLLGKKVDGLITDEQTGLYADPWVVALAEVRRRSGVAVVVVASENRKSPVKIPRLCHHFSLECIKHVELFRREGRTF